MEKEKVWKRFNGAVIHRPLAAEIRQVLARETAQGHELKVCIGTDSQVKGRETEFATVIVFIRKGKGGFMYVNKESLFYPLSIRQRMLSEVSRSIEVALALCPVFSRYGVDMELHVDINTNPQFKSNEALKEAMGYIRGLGIEFRAKPHAFASSSCANKLVQ